MALQEQRLKKAYKGVLFINSQRGGIQQAYMRDVQNLVSVYLHLIFMIHVKPMPSDYAAYNLCLWGVYSVIALN